MASRPYVPPLLLFGLIAPSQPARHRLAASEQRYHHQRREDDRYIGHRSSPSVTLDLKRLADNLAPQASIFFFVADDLAVKRDDPPAIAVPFRRQKRGVQRAALAEDERAGRGVNYSRRSGLDSAAIV